MKKFGIPIIVFLVGTIGLNPIPLKAWSIKKPLSFEHLTTKEGLPSEMVNAIAVHGDSIWIGTYAGGATQYDPLKRTFRAFTTKGEPMAKTDDGDPIKWKNLLSYNHVSVILPEGDRIWFGTYFYGFGGGGISYYQPTRIPPWKTFNTYNGLAKKIVSIAADRDRVWVGSEKGLSVLDKQTEQWKAFYSMEKGLPGNFVNALLLDQDLLWVGTSGGICRYNKSKKTWKTYSTREGLGNFEIKALARVTNRIWAGSPDGALFEYDPATDRWKRIEPTDPLKAGGIYSIVVAKDIVFICRDSGVSFYEVSNGQWGSFTASDGLLSNTVFCAAEGRNGVWFGTDKGASHLILSP